MKTKFLSLCCVFATILLLTSCAPVQRERTLFAMDTVMTISVYGDEKLLDECENTIHSIEKKLSVTLADSEINRLNEKKEALLSPDTFALIKSSVELCEKTDGAIDISIYPLIREWGFTTGQNSVPSEAKIHELLSNIDFCQIKLGSDSVTLPRDMCIDLGCVAKGYTSDALIKLLSSSGCRHALINLGGNVHALGAKPDGSSWRIAIIDPDNTDSFLGSVEIESKAVITSGGYQRFFEENGEIYHHIIDPATGYPARSGLNSVTIVGDSGLYCDGLSTALFVMGLDEATTYWRARRDFEAILSADDGTVYITEGLKDSFSLIKETSLEIIEP